MSRGVLPASAARRPAESETFTAPAGIAYAEGATVGVGSEAATEDLAVGSVQLYSFGHAGAPPLRRTRPSPVARLARTGRVTVLLAG